MAGGQVASGQFLLQPVAAHPGLDVDRLEEELARGNLTTGHYPQSIAISTVGGWIAASSAGQASTGFGAIEDVLLGLTAVLPDGEILRCRPVPRSAAGPDLKRLLTGSEGTLAVVTEATLACRARPKAWDWLAFGYQDFATMATALRDVRRAETGAAVLRGYDETDAQLGFSALQHTTGCVALAGFPAGPAHPPGLGAAADAGAGASRDDRGAGLARPGQDGGDLLGAGREDDPGGFGEVVAADPAQERQRPGVGGVVAQRPRVGADGAGGQAAGQDVQGAHQADSRPRLACPASRGPGLRGPGTRVPARVFPGATRTSRARA